MNIVDPQGSDPSIVQPSTTYVGDVPKMDLERTLPRQISTGSLRGTQTITGSLLVNDPTSNNTVINISGVDQNILVSNPTDKIPQIVLAKQSDGRYGMKVAPPGINVLEASDSQLIFNSNQNVFKIVEKLSNDFGFISSAGASTQDVRITHNLGYIPAYLAFATNTVINPYISTPSTLSIPMSVYSVLSGVAGFVSAAYIEATSATANEVNFQVGVYTSAGMTISGTIVVYFLQETAVT